MKDEEIMELIEFQGHELRDIIEHSVIVSSKRISESITNGLGEIHEKLNDIFLELRVRG